MRFKLTKRESCDIYHTIFNSAGIGIAAIDTKGRFTLVNQAWCKILGYSEPQAYSMTYLDITPPDDHEVAIGTFRAICSGELDFVSKRRQYIKADGKTIWVDLYVSPMTDDAGNTNGLLGAFVNVDKEVKYYLKLESMNEVLENIQEQLMKDTNTISRLNEELKIAYAKMEDLARHDTLTGLYNRRVLNEVLEREISRTLRTGTACAVAIADIDNFKKVNDNYGHECGDIVLQETSKVLRAAIRNTDTVGRWGGEEFLMVLPDTTLEGVQVVMNRLMRDMRKLRIAHEKDFIKPRLSIGCFFHTDDMSVSEVIVEADRALYIAKNNGKDQVCYL